MYTFTLRLTLHMMNLRKTLKTSRTCRNRKIPDKEQIEQSNTTESEK